MAWKQAQRMGERRSLGLMKSVMHFRAKELNKRSAFPANEVGKSGMDAWNHERVYLRKPVAEGGTLADFLLPMRITPLDFTIANDFMEGLTENERQFLDDLTAGFKLKEISKRKSLPYSRILSLRTSIQEKAVAYL